MLRKGNIWKLYTDYKIDLQNICQSVPFATYLPMMTSSNADIFRVTGHLCGEFTGPAQRPVTRSFGVFFDLRLNKRLSKQSWGWLFETPSRPLWRHRNDSHASTYAFRIGVALASETFQIWFKSHPHPHPHPPIKQLWKKYGIYIKTQYLVS